VFGGYVFLFGNEMEHVASLKTSRLSRVLPVNVDWELGQDLQNLSRLIVSNARLTIERWLNAGRRVRVKAGALGGVEGVVISRRENNRLFVAVNLLQQGVSVDIDGLDAGTARLLKSARVRTIVNVISELRWDGRGRGLRSQHAYLNAN
jgi:hypothetical protein